MRSAALLEPFDLVGRSIPEALRPFPLLTADDRSLGAINSFSGWGLGGIPGTPVTTAWPAANAAIFMPIRVPVPVTVDKLATGTGSGTGGNYDLGIYDEAGNRLVSTGSTAKPGASQESIVDVADTLLKPGLYYLAMAVDGVGSYLSGGFAFAAMTKGLGMRRMETAFPLPSTATFATHTGVMIPLLSAYLKREVFKPWRGVVRWPPLNTISTVHFDSIGAYGSLLYTLSNFASAAMGQNLIYYYPFTLQEMATAYALTVLTGATANGNLDGGIYDAAGNLIVSSGSTAQAAANSLTTLDIADTRLGPGSYFMAVQSSSATATAARASVTDELIQGGMSVLTEAAGGFGLPSAATFADPASATPAVVFMAVHFNSLI